MRYLFPKKLKYNTSVTCLSKTQYIIEQQYLYVYLVIRVNSTLVFDVCSGAFYIDLQVLRKDQGDVSIHINNKIAIFWNKNNTIIQDDAPNFRTLTPELDF